MNHSCKCAKPALNTVMSGPFCFNMDANDQENRYLRVKRTAIEDLADNTYFLSILSEYYDCTRWPTTAVSVAECAKKIIKNNYSNSLTSQLTTTQMILYCDDCHRRINLEWPIDRSNIRSIAKSNPILNFRFCMVWCCLHYSEVILKVAHMMRTEQQARRDDLQQELSTFMLRDLIPAITRYIDWE